MVYVNESDGLKAIVEPVMHKGHTHKAVLIDVEADEVFAVIFGTEEQAIEAAEQFVAA